MRKKASDRAKERNYTDLRLDLDERKEQLPCFSLDFGDDRRSTSRSGNVNLAIFITSMSGSESLRLSLTASSTSADHRALGWRLMRPKGMENLAAISVREVKRAAAEERERDEYSSAEGQLES